MAGSFEMFPPVWAWLVLAAIAGVLGWAAIEGVLWMFAHIHLSWSWG